MARTARTLWIPRHEPQPGCWCRPWIEEVAGGLLVHHRFLQLAPDSRPRAFVPLRRGVPA